MKKYILSAFLGITITVNAQVLNVPEITQEYDQWCWVGVSKCVLDYYGYSHLQCEIAEYTRNVSTWHNFGSTPCCNNALQGCNYWNYNWGETGSIQDILVHFGNISNNGTGVLSISNIQNNLNQQRPFIIRWNWLDGSGGHFVVGYGIQNNNVYYMDPWFGEGYKISTYENIRNDGWHEWTHTNVLLVSPQETGIAGIERVSVEIYPNPVKDMLQIENGEQRINRIEIVDLSGKVIFQSNSLRNQINVSDLSQGIYFVKLETEKGTVTKKFVKE
jgi:hypothetical protein